MTARQKLYILSLGNILVNSIKSFKMRDLGQGAGGNLAHRSF